MNIAHIVCRYPPYYSGMGNVVFQTASELAKLGHDITVITPNYYESQEVRPASAKPAEEHAPELAEEIDYASRLKPSISYGNAARLPRLGAELDEFDLVHLHYPFFGTANLVRRWKQKHPERPLVITYHMDTRGDGWKGLVFKLYARYFMPRILGCANALIGSSFDYIEASDARQFYKQTKNKWRELSFGVDTERFHPRAKPTELAARLALDPTQPTVLFVGGMDKAHYFKGIPVLLQALALLKRGGKSIQAILVGGGDRQEYFTWLAESLGLARTTRFVGQVSDAELPDYYNLADLFVLPSTTAGEAFGMVILEAMASGVPVIASDLPGVRTVAQDAGLLVEPGNANDLAECIMGFFMSDNNRDNWRLRVREAAVAKYTWKPIVVRLDEIYRSLI